MLSHLCLWVFFKTPLQTNSFKTDSSFRFSSNSVPPLPLHFFVEKVEKTMILGKSMSLERKRKRDCEPVLSSCKRLAPQPRLDERRVAARSWGNQRLEEADPELCEIMNKEKKRQFLGIELIVSEYFVCGAVMEALGSHLTNKYSEGMPGASVCRCMYTPYVGISTEEEVASYSRLSIFLCVGPNSIFNVHQSCAKRLGRRVSFSSF
ncbi:hypothetical protein GQ457_12G015290 [Hibiscus cannabinus]